MARRKNTIKAFFVAAVSMLPPFRWWWPARSGVQGPLHFPVLVRGDLARRIAAIEDFVRAPLHVLVLLRGDLARRVAAMELLDRALDAAAAVREPAGHEDCAEHEECQGEHP